jgi:hypothetical protein
MQGKRIGGRFIILPCEALDIINKNKFPEGALYIYIELLHRFVVDEDWETEGDWIIGSIKATKQEISDKMKMSRSEFYDQSQGRPWQSLINSGLIVENGKNEIIIPMLRRKIDTAVSPAHIKELENRIKILESLLKPSDNNPPENLPENPNENLNEKDSGTDVAKNEQNDPNRIKNDPNRIKNDPNRIISSNQGPGPWSYRSEDYDDEDAEIYNKCENGKKEFIKTEIVNLWPMRGYKAEIDDAIIAQLKNFTNDKISEAFAAAKRSRVAGGRYNWILNRLEHPEEYKKYSRGRNYKNGKSGGSKINIRDAGKEGKGEILGLECDWLENN